MGYVCRWINQSSFGFGDLLARGNLGSVISLTAKGEA